MYIAYRHVHAHLPPTMPVSHDQEEWTDRNPVPVHRNGFSSDFPQSPHRYCLFPPNGCNMTDLFSGLLKANLHTLYMCVVLLHNSYNSKYIIDGYVHVHVLTWSGLEDKYIHVHVHIEVAGLMRSYRLGQNSGLQLHFWHLRMFFLKFHVQTVSWSPIPVPPSLIAYPSLMNTQL